MEILKQEIYLLINKEKDKIAMIDWQYIKIGLGLKLIIYS